MIINLSKDNPLIGQFVAEMRDIEIQQDRMRFRRNMERLGEIFAYEISKKMPTTTRQITTPMGVATCVVPAEQPVVASILRAGLPLQTGILNFFDQADAGFISAYRKHHKNGKFTIKIEYISCPNLDDRTLIVCDPMLATGQSMVLTLQELLQYGTPKHLHIVSLIACTEGIQYLLRHFSNNFTLWAAAVDEELTAKGYIVPGLGDAGDLSFGAKLQE